MNRRPKTDWLIDRMIWVRPLLRIGFVAGPLSAVPLVAFLSLGIGAVPSSLRAETPDVLKTFRSEFVHLTPGRGKFPADFAMGCETASKLAKPEQHFSIAKYEVTQALWAQVMGSNPSRWKGPRNSVEMVSYSDSQRFCQKVTKLLRQSELIEKDQVVRLPTELEWEYATRAGTTSAYSFGDQVSKLDEYAWSTHNAAGNDPPVGAKKPNPWGLYDVHGYLWEWCQPTKESDRVSEAGGKRTCSSKEAASDRSTEKTTPKHGTAVIRGGSWKDAARELRSCSRRVVKRISLDDAVGLRCVLARE